MTQITTAQPDDLPAIMELLARNDLPTDGLAEHIGTAIVARDGAAIVGSAALETYRSAALLRSVAVDASHRGQGLGAELVQTALDLARSHGLRSIYLLTTSAPEYFPRFGFRPVPRDAVRPDVLASAEFTGACPTSALVMAADLP